MGIWKRVMEQLTSDNKGSAHNKITKAKNTNQIKKQELHCNINVSWKHEHVLYSHNRNTILNHYCDKKWMVTRTYTYTYM